MEDKIDELKKEIERLKKNYSDELKRKDKLIEELREQNTVIMRSALKQSEKLSDITERMKKAQSKKKA